MEIIPSVAFLKNFILSVPLIFLICGTVSWGKNRSQASNLPFILGERLEYDLKWGFFPVGSAVMEVSAHNPEDKKGPVVIRFQAKTNSFADAFYKVRTSITSWVDRSFSRTLSYEKSQREGSTSREIKAHYNYEKGECTYALNNNPPETISLPGVCFDPLSIAYYFRVHPIEPNSVKQIPVCDGKKFREVRVHSGNREIIKLLGARISVFPTVPAMNNLGGVFNKSPKGLLKVWYSHDDRRVPVKVSSKVVVGSFTATLKSAYPPLVGVE